MEDLRVLQRALIVAHHNECYELELKLKEMILLKIKEISNV